MKKFYIKTHGCKSNQLESQAISEKLKNAGYEKTDIADNSDIFILNSCSVTENADIEALRTIRHIKTQNPSILTILTGCSAQLNSETLINMDYIDIILGNNDKFEIVEAIQKNESKIEDIFKIKDFNNQLIHDYSNTRGYLKIQDGCNNYCSYCTIPFARGNSRSNSIENILKQIEIYTEIGIKEVVLTGIHIGQWGQDFEKKKELYNLLEKIEQTKIDRYRLGSLNTLEISDNLINFLAQSNKFCPHFHLSLQSLTNKTLEAMNRKYTAESCIELMEKLHSSFDLPFLGSDIIVGFPNESDKDFETTLDNVKKSKLSNIHVFPYSIRKNTIAGEMKNQIQPKIKKERAKTLQSIAKEKYNNFINLNIGKERRVLIEKRPDKKTGFVKAVTDNYLTVLIDTKDKNVHNTIQKIKILNRKNENLFCNIIE